MTIYDKTGKLILDIPVDDTSYRYRSIRQGDKVFLYYSLSEHVEVPLYRDNVIRFGVLRTSPSTEPVIWSTPLNWGAIWNCLA